MTANARFVWDNVGDDAASLTATSEAGSLVAANLQADERAATWRSSSTVGSPPVPAPQTLTFQWADAQTVDSVCFAWTNLTSTATIRCRGYTNTGGSGLQFDQTVSPDTGLTIGNVTVQNWIASSAAIKELQILITDDANPDVYVEASRAVIGLRIEPVANADQQGFSIGWKEQTRPVRAESLDLRVEPLGRFRWLKLPLRELEPTSRNAIVNMVNNGLGRGVWVSAFPESSDAATRQMHSFWGALVQEVGYDFLTLDIWSASLMFEEMG